MQVILWKKLKTLKKEMCLAVKKNLRLPTPNGNDIKVR